ncbi:hypothetical protein BDV28DRAFT_139911 [Aspergillus coremiiformis]|uniref:KOW domain-containing protein n=1 Tax=Aspergillus coremiiformis TaxID=138285 RepID=A0A5N6YZB8_9EURO|nr:hypothetical protein BDV28DRAFT_139911 [Aspergillus coremiiformis]
MQKVIRRTALARNQAQRKAIRSTKQTEREEAKDYLKQQFSFKRMELDNIRAARYRRRDDWLRGPLAHQHDTSLEGQTFGALSAQALNPPALPQRLRRRYINIAVGDRVCIINGQDKGKINEVTRVNIENETVTVKDLNISDVHLPGWVNSQYGGKGNVSSVALPIPMDDVRLVIAVKSPRDGKTRDNLVEHVYAGGPILEREPGSETPRHTRYVAGTHIEIPWPSAEEQNLKDEDWDTLRMEVETPTWTPSLHYAPFPPSVLDEVRNKFSKYRTRHDPEWVEAKMLEDYRKEYLQSRSLLTPKGELMAMIRAKKEELLNARKDADGNIIMDDKTVGFIENFLKEQKANKA